MKESFGNIEDLIGKCLTPEATTEERAALERWLAEGEENRTRYNQYKALFEKTSSLGEWQSFDTDTAWNTVREKISRRHQLNPFKRYWQVAASIIIVMGAGYILYSRFMMPQNGIVLATQDVARQDTLPDGTLAFMNRDTKLSYEYNPSKEKRVAKLAGEAFFEIKEVGERQFIVEAAGVFVEDIGTSFNVRNYPGDSIVQVFVESGAVAMYTSEDTGLKLSPGEKGEYNKKTRAFVKFERASENITSYKSKSFEFEAARLAELVSSLNKVYDRKLRIENPKLDDCRITVSFDNESIEVIAEVIAETLKLTLTKSDDEIVLSCDACPQ